MARELIALGIGLVLIALGWTIERGGERSRSAALAGERAGGAAEVGARGEPPLRPPSSTLPSTVPSTSLGPALRPTPSPTHRPTQRDTPRLAAPDAPDPGGAGQPERAASSREAAARKGDGGPSVEPLAWPADGVHLRVTAADGAPAVGAPIGVWVAGGRAPLALAECDGEGRVRFAGIASLAAGYELGLAAPGASRVHWPRVASSGEDAGTGLTREAPLELALPPCGTLEVHVVRPSRPATSVELGEGNGADFLVARSRAAEADGVARFRWLPLGRTVTLRVPFQSGPVELVVAGPAAPSDRGSPPDPAVTETLRVRVGPDGRIEG